MQKEIASKYLTRLCLEGTLKSLHEDLLVSTSCLDFNQFVQYIENGNRKKNRLDSMKGKAGSCSDLVIFYSYESLIHVKTLSTCLVYFVSGQKGCVKCGYTDLFQPADTEFCQTH